LALLVVGILGKIRPNYSTQNFSYVIPM